MAILCTFAGSRSADAATVNGDLKIFVLNVGQGDAFLVVCPHGTHQMLIDAGDRNYPGSQTAFRQQLQALMGTDHTLEVVVSSHPHEDHIGSLEWVLTTFRVKKFQRDDTRSPDDMKCRLGSDDRRGPSQKARLSWTASLGSVSVTCARGA